MTNATLPIAVATMPARRLAPSRRLCYGARTLAPDKMIELVNDLSAHRISIEY